MKITCIVKNPGKSPEQKEIENNLQGLQEVVGGYIETVYLGRGLTLIVNEEGKLNGMEPNIYINGDLIVGPALIVGYDGSEDFVSLTQPQIDAVMEVFSSTAFGR